MASPRPGQHDYSHVRLTQHALERFVERFDPEPALAESSLRTALSQSRRLGRNPTSGAIAVLALYQDQPLVAILQNKACVTLLTLRQFETRLQDFGRSRLPKKLGRMLRRLLPVDDNPTSSDPDLFSEADATMAHDFSPNSNRRFAGGPGPNSGSNRPSPGRARSKPHQRGNGGGGGGPKRSPIGLRLVSGNDYELVHPRDVEEMMPDYQEGIELWKENEPEAAQDALRYALEGSRYSFWIHTALGQVALKETRDPGLARGHFAYVLELAERAIPFGFNGRLPRDRYANQPLFEAIDGLVLTLEALGEVEGAARVRTMAKRWEFGPKPSNSGQ